MLGATLTFVLWLLMYASVFALVFGAFGAGAIGILFALGPEPAAKEQFINAVVAWMFVVYAAIGGAAVGAITGALYALVPPRSRSILIAGALGAGMVLACSLLSGLGAVYPLGWIFAVVALATTASMIAGWIVRKLETGSRSSSADVVVK